MPRTPGSKRTGVGARLVGFGAAALLALGGGLALGAAVGPIDSPDAPSHQPDSSPSHRPGSPAPTPALHDHPGASR